MTVCGGWSLAARDRGATRAITLFCNAWSCPDCSPRRMGMLKRLARNGNPNKFLTLTIRKSVAANKNIAAQMLSDAFKLLIKRWRRKFPGREVEYLVVTEPHVSGYPHLHVCMRAPWTDQKWLSNVMSELLDSPHVDIRAVSDKSSVARYIAKYITKANKRFGKLKRYWTSRKYEIGAASSGEADKEKLVWSIIKSPLWLLERGWRAAGFTVAWQDKHTLWCFDRGTDISAVHDSERWRW